MVETTTLAEQLKERLQHEPYVQVDASLDEYWNVLNELGEEPYPMEYDIEYFNGSIHAKTGMASDRHETIVANIIALLRSLYYDTPDLRVMGSNRTVYIPSCEMAVKPDVLVVQGETQLFPRKGQESGILNPYLLVEVQSDSTQKEDLGDKLRCYKQIDSLQYIIHINQYVPFVSVYSKQQDNRHWLNEDFDSLDQTVQFGTVAFAMKDVYHKV